MTDNLFSKFNPEKNSSLAAYTTWKVGGPAEILIKVKTVDDLVEILEIATNNAVPITILGGGSNVLISDLGIPGLVIINQTSQIHFPNKTELDLEIDNQDFDIYTDKEIAHRHIEVGDEFYSFADLEFVETGKKTQVIFDSGVKLQIAIAQTLKHGFTGLQWFAGIPSTIGGGLYNNIHGGTRHFSEYFKKALVYIPNQKPEWKDYDFFEFGYDQSILRKNPEIIILQVALELYQTTDLEQIDLAKKAATQWTYRKKRQPSVSAGCNFKNIPIEKQQELDFPTPSVGWLIDKKFEWVGKKIGGAFISAGHANFIENDGTATASDIYNLIQEIKQKAKQDYNLDLEEEIKLLGHF